MKAFNLTAAGLEHLQAVSCDVALAAIIDLVWTAKPQTVSGFSDNPLPWARKT